MIFGTTGFASSVRERKMEKFCKKKKFAKKMKKCKFQNKTNVLPLMKKFCNFDSCCLRFVWNPSFLWEFILNFLFVVAFLFNFNSMYLKLNFFQWHIVLFKKKDWKYLQVRNWICKNKFNSQKIILLFLF